MFLVIIIVSIVTLLVLIQNNKGKDNAFYRSVAGICLVFSWAVIVMWFAVLTETWQIALNTPVVNNVSIPVWGRIVQNLLRSVVYVFPVSRLMLAILYALPILLIPMVLFVMRRSQVTSILLYSTLMNLLFFGVQLLADNWIHTSFIKIPIQGVVLLTTYAFLLYALIRQRPFNSRFQ